MKKLSKSMMTEKNCGGDYDHNNEDGPLAHVDDDCDSDDDLQLGPTAHDFVLNLSLNVKSNSIGQ